MRALSLVVIGDLASGGILRGQEPPNTGEDIYVALISYLDERHRSSLSQAHRLFPRIPYQGVTFLLEADRLPSFRNSSPAGAEMLRAVSDRLSDRNVRTLPCQAPCVPAAGQIALRELRRVEKGDPAPRRSGLLLEALLAGSIRGGNVYEDRVLYWMVRRARGWEVVQETPIWHGDYRRFGPVPDSLRQGPADPLPPAPP